MQGCIAPASPGVFALRILLRAKSRAYVPVWPPTRAWAQTRWNLKIQGWILSSYSLIRLTSTESFTPSTDI